MTGVWGVLNLVHKVRRWKLTSIHLRVHQPS